MEAVIEKKAQAQEYKLSDADRQKILSQSPAAKRHAKQTTEIERQRQAFIEKNGDDGMEGLGLI